MRGRIMEGTIREFKLECKGWKRETEVVGGVSFTSRFDIDKITQIGWLRFVEKIVRRYHFVLYALFDLESMKRFE